MNNFLEAGREGGTKDIRKRSAIAKKEGSSGNKIKTGNRNLLYLNVLMTSSGAREPKSYRK